MKKLLLSAVLCASVFSNPAMASNRTYVSKNGSDSNNCTSDATPCKTFGSAIVKAQADGEVVCLDSGFFGSLVITFSITIMCEQHIGQTGSVNNSVTLPAGGVAVLNGVDVDWREFAGVSLTFNGVGTLIIQNSSFRSGTDGLKFAPTGSAKLVIANTSFYSNSNAGVLIEPAGAGTFQVDMDNVKSTNNLGGVSVIATAGETVQLEMRNSLLAQNSNYGLYSNASGGGVSAVFVDNSSISNNASIGVYSTGASSFVLVNRSVLARNNIGWAFAAGGTLASYGTNVVSSISGAGGPSATIGLQ